MTTYALVHGAWHGAWCWDHLAAELHRRGHHTVAVDLPDGDPAAGCASYAETVTAALGGAGQDVVLVGHSLGGLTIPLVAAARPVRRLVFLSALLPQPGRSLDDQVAADPSMICPGLGDGQRANPERLDVLGTRQRRHRPLPRLRTRPGQLGRQPPPAAVLGTRTGNHPAGRVAGSGLPVHPVHRRSRHLPTLVPAGRS